jgi:hypothetical protein
MQDDGPRRNDVWQFNSRARHRQRSGEIVELCRPRRPAALLITLRTSTELEDYLTESRVRV